MQKKIINDLNTENLQSINFHDANKSIFSGNDECIESWSEKKDTNRL